MPETCGRDLVGTVRVHPDDDPTGLDARRIIRLDWIDGWTWITGRPDHSGLYLRDAEVQAWRVQSLPDLARVLGHPDPTPCIPGERVCCRGCSPRGLCTRPLGHLGAHIAGDGHRVIGVCPADDEASPSPEQPRVRAVEVIAAELDQHAGSARDAAEWAVSALLAEPGVLRDLAASLDHPDPAVPGSDELLIVTHPARRGGRPTIGHTRLDVATIWEWLAAGETVEQICRAYPHVTAGQVRVVEALRADLTDHDTDTDTDEETSRDE